MPDYALIDRRKLAVQLFFPRRETSPPPAGATDWRVEVAPGVALGGRSWPLESASRAVLLFHGNGEVASDYDSVAPAYHALGASLSVADYRGYGASQGQPSFASLVADAHPVLAAFHARLDEGGFSGSRFVMGRSLGSLPAAELAATAAERLAGLVLESGAPDLSRFREPDPDDAELSALIRAHGERMASIRLPVLQIHGEDDQLIPLERAQAFHRELRCEKSLVVIPGAGHNDIAWVGRERYFASLGRFLSR